jgi:hypothetical protein
MTSKQRRPSRDESHDPRESIAAARKAAREVARQESELDVDPASELFFEFAAPLLLDTSTEEEFEIAVTIAEFIWTATHFSAAEQVFMLDEFIRETNVPEDMVPWLIDVYSQLAQRKEELVG